MTLIKFRYRVKYIPLHQDEYITETIILEIGDIERGVLNAIPGTFITILSRNQYINCKDKNNKEIYEGDCFKMRFYPQDKNEVVVVALCGHKYRVMHGHRDYAIRHILDKKIIGNIYENPELLDSVKQ